MPVESAGTRTWIQPEPVSIPSEVLEACGGNTLLASILVRRGLTDPQEIQAFLDPEEYTPSSPDDFPGMADAVQRILDAAIHKEKVLIWGDFDVDGQTSTTILVDGFEKLGWQIGQDLFYHIPHRETEGHGVHLPTLESLIQGIGLVVTCDTGISAKAELEAVIRRGVDVIVTDHHTPPDDLPSGAVALINPHFLPDGHPARTLAGCGVAYLLAQTLLTACGKPSSGRDLLDLVALGLVADVAELRGDARYLVQRGLQVLRENRRLGLAYLYNLMDMNPSRMIETQIGFQIAPRLNALGRLSDANRAVEFFTTQNAATASYLAQELEGYNTERRLLTDQVLQAALHQIEQNQAWKTDPILVLSHPGWVGGVLGIVASHLVEEFHKPVILIREGDGGIAAGSARSVVGIDITQAISAQADILRKFGGHPMAAGFSLPADLIPEFRQRIIHTIRKMSSPDQGAEAMLEIEGVVTLADILGETGKTNRRPSFQMLEELEALAPYGVGNPAPVFSLNKVFVREAVKIGATGDHLAVTIEDEQGKNGRVMWWQGGGKTPPEGWFNLACTIRMNEFGGKRQPQLEWVDAQELPESAQVSLPGLHIQFIDYRDSVNPIGELERLRKEINDLAIWAEGADRKVVHGTDRNNLGPCHNLMIWTTPPGAAEMRRVIEMAQPRVVYLVCADPSLDRIDAFLTRLVGILSADRYAHQQPVKLDALAAAMAHRPVTVGLGLRYLAKVGKIRLSRMDQTAVEYEIVPVPDAGKGNAAHQQLQFSLSETAAYRRSIRQQPVEQWKSQFSP